MNIHLAGREYKKKKRSRGIKTLENGRHPPSQNQEKTEKSKEMVFTVATLYASVKWIAWGTMNE